MTPFVIFKGLFPVSSPPPLTSRHYTAAFNEVKRLGGDGIITPTERTEDQTIAGIYWAYDGTPGLGTPPRMYNQITVQIAEQMETNVVELARLLALVNVALADASIACWDEKYKYQFWRPVTGIREADPGTGPTGLGDGNPATIGDPNFTPLGAPASNLTGPNFTPPFPSYTAGHSTYGGGHYSKSFASFSEETTFLSLSSPTNSTALPWTTEETCGRSFLAAFRRFPKLKRRTAGAESTLVFTGPSTAPKGSSMGGRLQTLY